MRLVWTEPALRDLASARAYVARDNPSPAVRQVEIIVSAVAGLLQFPHSGRPGRSAGTREPIIGRAPYLVPYCVRGEEIEILSVLHGRQRWPEQILAAFGGQTQR